MNECEYMCLFAKYYIYIIYRLCNYIYIYVYRYRYYCLNICVGGGFTDRVSFRLFNPYSGKIFQVAIRPHKMSCSWKCLNHPIHRHSNCFRMQVGFLRQFKSSSCRDYEFTWAISHICIYNTCVSVYTNMYKYVIFILYVYLYTYVYIYMYIYISPLLDVHHLTLRP